MDDKGYILNALPEKLLLFRDLADAERLLRSQDECGCVMIDGKKVVIGRIVEVNIRDFVDPEKVLQWPIELLPNPSNPEFYKALSLYMDASIAGTLLPRPATASP